MSSSTIRRSTRLRSATSIVPAQPSLPVIASSAKRALDDATSPLVRPKKRRLKAGSLKMVGEMPYEILVEIFSYALEPVDLYNLSRANSVLHTLLLSKSLAPALWEHAFKRVLDIPPCPAGLILPAYAELMYGRGCYYCPSVRDLFTVWKCYVRVCAGCFTSHFVEVPKDKITVLRNIVPLTDGPKHLKLPPSSSCLRGDYEREVAAMESIMGDRKRWTEYVAQAYTRKNGRDNFHNIMWHRESTRKEREAAKIRTERRDAIMAKLHALGYSPETIETGNSWNLKKEKGLIDLLGFRVLKPLTEGDWAKISPKIIAFCHEHLIKDRTRIFRSFYEHYLADDPKTRETSPQFSEVLKMEPFKSTVYHSPATRKVAKEDFQQHRGQLPELLQAWTEAACAKLVKLMQQSQVAHGSSYGDSATFNPSVLHLATTVFSCKRCSKPVFYPTVLSHVCSPHLGNSSAVDSTIWDGEGLDEITYDPAHAMTIVKALGKDPTTTTAKEMDDYNQRVECLRCRIDLRIPRRLFMSWRLAVRHESERREHRHGGENGEGGWRMADTQMLAAVLEKEHELPEKVGTEPIVLLIN